MALKLFNGADVVAPAHLVPANKLQAATVIQAREANA
jgi:hypothetical protein